MIGQYSNKEFQSMLTSVRGQLDPVRGTAWIRYGKYTINYYQQHSDGSWTNYDCKTILNKNLL